MRCICFIILIFSGIFVTKTYAQQPSFDSVNQLVKAEKDDTLRVLLLLKLFHHYELSTPDMALKIIQQGLSLSKLIKYDKGEFECNATLAGFWFQKGDFATSIKMGLEAMKLAEANNNMKWIIAACGQLTSSYRDQGEYRESLSYALKAVKIQHEFYNCEDCGGWYPVVASIYYEMNQVDSAKWYFNQFSKYSPPEWMIGWIYATGGRIQAKAARKDSALYYYNLAINKLSDSSNPKDLAGTYHSLALLHHADGRHANALFSAQRALQIARHGGFNKEMMDASLLLSKIYEQKNADSALWYYKVGMSSKDSLFGQDKIKGLLSYKFNEELRKQQLEQVEAEYRNNLRIYVFTGIIIVFILLLIFFYRNNRQKQKANILLQQQKQKVESTLLELKATQSQLIQKEKMASLGELTAGIAHEIQNPLNFVNNFSEVNSDLINDLTEEVGKGNVGEVIAILKDLKANEEKINHHGRRAGAIVKGMLQHSKQTAGVKEQIDINALCDEYLRLSYHGIRAKDKNFSANIRTNFDKSIGKINIVPQDIGRVLLNLYNNAFYALSEQKKQFKEGYEPAIQISTKLLNDRIEIAVQDNGIGIISHIKDKIFQPFFTTKPTGQGTGLGLSLAYDIIKAHGGELKMNAGETIDGDLQETKKGEGAEFIIQLPIV